MQALTISEARKRLFEIREQVVNNHEEVIVTHRRGDIVLMSLDDWESYQETFRLLKDPAALKSLFQSFEARDREAVAGKSIDKVFSDLM